MYRILLAAALTIFALPAVAQDKIVLSDPAQTASLATEPASMVAFYRMNGDLMELTLIFRENEGETFRTRVNLYDDQSYKVVVGDPDESAPSVTEFRIHRAGFDAEISAVDLDQPGRIVAAN